MPRPADPPPRAPTPLPALVLAGRRRAGDPMAEGAGVSHKALLDVAGVPMLVRVLRSLEAAPSVGAIAVSIDDPARLDAVPGLGEAIARGALLVHRSLPGPSASVLDAWQERFGGAPLLLTTADHALLTPEMIEHFVREAAQSGADLAAAVVTDEVVRARHPDSPRTYVPLRGARITGANLFLLRTPAAARAVGFWSRTEGVRKRPWRLVSLFGPRVLARFLLRRLDLDGAMAEASRILGAKVVLIRMPFAEAAIDVDKPADLALASRVIEARERA